MTRRRFAGSLAASPLAAARATVRPKALRPGDTVGIITPSSFVADPDQLMLAGMTAEHFGLKMKLGRHVGKRTGYLGGTVEERLEDLHAMFADDGVQAVFALRGGYGASQLLDRIDYGLIRSKPKILAGYSDITALHLALHKRCGLVTFHAPTVLSAFSAFTQELFRKALFETVPLGAVTNPQERNPIRPVYPLRTVRPGRARGRLVGGNLTLISTLMGTPFEIDTKDCLLFLEDVGEEPYRIDRMLTQLRLAGKFDGIAGLVWGACSDCGPREFRPSFTSTFSTGELVDQFFGHLNVPVLSGLAIGHTSDQITLPMGVQATLDAGAKQLIVEESGVA